MSNIDRVQSSINDGQSSINSGSASGSVCGGSGSGDRGLTNKAHTRREEERLCMVTGYGYEWL